MPDYVDGVTETGKETAGTIRKEICLDEEVAAKTCRYSNDMRKPSIPLRIGIERIERLVLE